MRPIDADAVCERCRASGAICTGKDCEIPNMPTLTPPNEPLTIEQLREMDGQPVWDENGKCYLVDTTYRFCSCSDIEIAIIDKNGDVKRYPQRRALYRRPPEGEEDT